MTGCMCRGSVEEREVKADLSWSHVRELSKADLTVSLICWVRSSFSCDGEWTRM